MNGHYKTKTIKTIIHYGVVFIFFALIALAIWLFPTEVHVQTVQAEPTETVKFEEKIEALENEVLAELATCESGGTQEPEAAMILDSNDAMSIGKYMWQIKSLQHYADVFYDRSITRKEAILIALDAHPDISLDEITKKVIFEDEKGIKNWYICGERHELDTKVELINKLR